MRILWGLILEKEKLILNKLKVVIESAWSYIYRGTRHDCRSQCLVCCESLRRTALFLFFATLDRSFRKTTSIFSFVGLIHNIFYKTYKQLIFQIIVNNNFRGSRENNPRTWASIDPRLHVIAPPPPATRASCSLSLSLSVSPIVVETHISKHVCFFFIVVIGLKLLASCHMLYVTYITGRYIFK